MHTPHHDQNGVRVWQYVPPTDYLLRAGATGAMISGAWSAVADMPRVRSGEMTRDAAIGHALSSAAVGAGSGTAVGAAAHLARAHPLLGVAAVLAAGAGVLYLAGRGKQAQPAKAEAKATGDPDAKDGAETKASARRRTNKRATKTT